MVLIINNRLKGNSPNSEKYRSPTFKIPRPNWAYRAWKVVRKFFNMGIF